MDKIEMVLSILKERNLMERIGYMDIGRPERPNK